MNSPPAPTPPPRPSRDRAVAYLFAGILGVALFMAYRGAFSAPFVFDDTAAITDNPSIRHWSTAWWPPKDLTTTGRPVVNLSLALNYAWGGRVPTGYHLGNLAIHFLAALVLFGVVRRTLRSWGIAPALAADASLIAGGVAALWALHPLQTESVTYTIQRAESLVGLFYLLTLYAFIRATDAGGTSAWRSRSWLTLSFLACLMGMATKEVMASAPLMVLLYDRTFAAGTWRGALRARGRYYAALAATWLLLGALVISAEGRGGTVGLETAISARDYALTQCYAIIHYLRLAIWPTPLVFDYGTLTVTQISTIALPVVLLVGLAIATLRALRTRPALGFPGACFFAILAPSSSVVPIATQTMAEHRMYLPLAAVITLLVVAANRWLARPFMVGAVAIAAGSFALLTFQRNVTYGSAFTLWADTLAKAPLSARAHNNLGLALHEAGQSAAAFACFADALRLQPDYPDAHNNLGLALVQAGRTVEALSHYERALELFPGSVDAHNNYGNALRSLGRNDEALVQFEAALRLNPDHVGAHNNLGIALIQLGRTAEAQAQFERALQIDAESAESHANLGMALARSGRTNEGLAEFREATRLRPSDPAMLDRFGVALLDAGQMPEAIAQFEAALHLDSQLAGAHNHLGLALSRSGRATEGLTHLTEAVRLAPGDAKLHNDLGVALAIGGRIEEALQHYEEAVRLKPDFAEAQRNRARARAALIGR